MACPVDLTAALVRQSLAESCGKCTPCRVGLDRIVGILEKLLAGTATSEELALLEDTARVIYDSADCAIGFEAAKRVLDNLAAFRDDFAAHVATGVCTVAFAGVPCQQRCPAHVNVPGYIACIAAGRPADAVRVIRARNPFPGVCGLVCEHPCEESCRRKVVDDAVNIRALKRHAVEKAGAVPVPAARPANGKTVAVVGGGPAGLTAAYYLQLAGFQVTVFEQREKLGGMLRYGIPAYRLPDADLDRDLEAILSTGIAVRCKVAVGRDLDLFELKRDFDAVYLSIGAHGAKSLRIEGEDAQGVLSAVELLRTPQAFDFHGQRVVVVGGGNVAMDATRTAKRLGAKSVTCVYRRRIADMTALPEEVAGAQSEGCEIVQLQAPVRVAVEAGVVTGLVVQPQLAGPIRDGRPTPVKAALPETTIACDVVVSAIGQKVDATGLELSEKDGVFVGGDCDYGPSTVIRAIDAGRTAAAKVAQFLGGTLADDEPIDIPPPGVATRLHWGRVNATERPAAERQSDFGLMENRLTDEEALQECSRCLRCDHCGFGSLKRGCE